MSNRQGRVEAIFLAGEHGAPPRQVHSAMAHPGRGLVADRHFDEVDACDITLIEADVIDSARAEHGIDLSRGEARRQVVVRGVDLGDFIGRRFRVGEIECEGEERCEPCNHLASVVGTQVLKGLLHSGLRASIVKGGSIQPGDEVAPIGSGGAAERS